MRTVIDRDDEIFIDFLKAQRSEETRKKFPIYTGCFQKYKINHVTSNTF